MDSNTRPSPHRFPRDRAVKVLNEILAGETNRKGNPSFDDVVARVLPGEIQRDDRAWIQEIVQGVLRWKGRLDLVIDSYSKKEPPFGTFRLWLYTGMYQILAQHAVAAAPVASETVEYIKSHEGDAQGRFANAVLRKLVEERDKWLEDKPPRGNDEVVSIWYSLPLWMWKTLVADHKFKWADPYARASLERPAVWVRARGEFGQGEAGPVEGSFRLTGPRDIRSLAGYEAGTFFVQDISSQLLIHEVSSRVNPSGTRKRALDVCAAPGGKSIGLAWNGFEVTALDFNPNRLPRLRENVDRLAPKDVTIGDFSGLDSLGEFDLVWVDPPCTGTGVLRRHPEIRWHRTPEDVGSLNEIQRDLVRRGWARVKPGGFLAYSVCSVLKSEGESLLDWPSFGGEIVAQWLLSPAEPPHGDGFWAILLRKTG